MMGDVETRKKGLRGPRELNKAKHNEKSLFKEKRTPVTVLENRTRWSKAA